MAIRAVFFDIGGVLQANPPTGWKERWEVRLGMRTGGMDERLAPLWRAGAVSDLAEPDVISRVRVLLGMDEAAARLMMEDAWAEYLGSPNSDLVRCFAALRPRWKTGIISNSFAGARQRESRRYGYADLCDVVIYSHEVGMEKPDAGIFLLACQRLGVAPGESLFVDDVPGHLAAARALGMHTVHVQTPQQALADVQSALSDGSAGGVPRG